MDEDEVELDAICEAMECCVSRAGLVCMQCMCPCIDVVPDRALIASNCRLLLNIM